jgi:hypothetical protein
MLPTPVWVDGFKTHSPNHLIKRLNIEAAHLVGLYLWFIDGVAALKGKESEVEVLVVKYHCPSCGDYEREPFELIAGVDYCPVCHKSPDKTLDSPVYVSERYRGSVLWGQPISYKDIGESVGKDWRRIQRQVQELVKLGYIEAKRETIFDSYSYYVSNSCKYRHTSADPVDAADEASTEGSPTSLSLSERADIAFADEGDD